MQQFDLAADFLLFSDPCRNSTDMLAEEEGGGVFITKEPMMSADECAMIIKHAEDVTKHRGGWSTSRHYSVPTTDVPLHQLPADVLKWFNQVLEVKLFPMLALQFGAGVQPVSKHGAEKHSKSEPLAIPPFCADDVRVHDAFIVKYDSAMGQRQLPIHCDQSQFSFTIALNGLDEYEGGGTFFEALGRPAAKADVGHVVSFPGGLWAHGGEPITSGTR
jgi:hypothetical protein